MAHIFVCIAGIVHLYIFVMESLLWGRPRINRIFNVSAEQAEQNRLFAFNQGFYNLFLSLGAMIGVALSFTSHSSISVTLMAFTSLSMFAASIVLICSDRKLFRPAIIQGLPPLLGLLFLVLGKF